jgi:hypothetical protein
LLANRRPQRVPLTCQSYILGAQKEKNIKIKEAWFVYRFVCVP